MKKLLFLTAVFFIAAVALQAQQAPRPLPQHVQQMDSATRLGWMYYRGIGTKRNYKKAYHWFEKGAISGSEQALFFRASMLQNGRGVQKDEKRAFAIFDDLARKYANPHAAFRLSLAYEKGIGCDADEKEGQRWLDFAVENNIAPAQLKKGLSLLKTDPKAGAKLVQKAAEQTHFRWAQYKLALLYADGTGVKKDPARAFELMQQTAQRGFVKAQWELAQWTEQGFGTEKDEKKAFELTLKAAQNGSQPAQEHVAQLYRTGTGTPVNLKEAKRWEKQAKKTAKKQPQKREEFY